MSEEKKAPSFANKAYVQAEKILRERHKDEFETILSGLYEEAGVKRRVRLSAEERAEKIAEERAQREIEKIKKRREAAAAQAAALAAEFPDLIEVKEPLSAEGVIADILTPAADDSAA